MLAMHWGVGCFGKPLSELLVTSLSTLFVPFNDCMAHRISLMSAESDQVPVSFLDRPNCMGSTNKVAI